METRADVGSGTPPVNGDLVRRSSVTCRMILTPQKRVRVRVSTVTVSARVKGASQRLASQRDRKGAALSHLTASTSTPKPAAMPGLTSACSSGLRRI